VATNRFVTLSVALLTICVFSFSIFLRFFIFYQEGGDHKEYRRAVTSFIKGVNPYRYTVRSFSNPTLDHGYAYLPTLLYIQSLLSSINHSLNLNVPTAFLWKIPVLLADLGVAVLLIKYFSNKNHFLGLFCVSLWLLNPYFLVRYEYTLYDPLLALFLFVAFLNMGKRDFLSGLCYALAISFKIVPIIFFPVLFIKAKDKKVFILAMLIVFGLVTIPFLRSYEDFVFYIRGSLLVHSNRGIQGRPILSFITYHLYSYGVNFFQSYYAKLYSVIALLLGPLISIYASFVRKSWSGFVLSLPIIVSYLVFTPVFNRTHIIWFIPVFIIGIYEFVNQRQTYFYLLLGCFYLLSSIYLYLWIKGYKDPKYIGGPIWMDNPTAYKSSIRLFESLPLIYNSFK